MDEVFARIAENTVKFNLGDEEASATHPPRVPAPPYTDQNDSSRTGAKYMNLTTKLPQKT